MANEAHCDLKTNYNLKCYLPAFSWSNDAFKVLQDQSNNNKNKTDRQTHKPLFVCKVLKPQAK